MKNDIWVCLNESVQNTVKIPERGANRNQNSSGCDESPNPAAFCVLMALSRPLGHLPVLGPGNGVQRALRENDGENRVPADWEEQKKVLGIE